MRCQGKTIALLTVAVGLVVLATLCITSRHQLMEQWHLWKLGIRKAGDDGYAFVPKSGTVGERVNFMAGEIEIREFFQFLADYTGLPVQVRAQNLEFFQNTILLAAPMQNVTGDVGIAILKANRFPVDREVLPGGAAVLRIDPPKAHVPKCRKEPNQGQLVLTHHEREQK